MGHVRVQGVGPRGGGGGARGVSKGRGCGSTKQVEEDDGASVKTIMSQCPMSVAMPRLLYGCQVWPISDHIVELMERAHQDAARRLQGLPQQCAGPAATALMGWLSVQATIDMYRLIYLWTLLRIPNFFF